MKKIFTILLAIVACTGFIHAEIYSGTCGADAGSTNLQWKLDTETGLLKITGLGDMRNYNSGTDLPWYAKRVYIQNIVISEGVTSIGNHAFTDCAMNSVTIPNSVTTIGDYAFNYGYKLQSITIPNSVISIGYGAFACCWSLTSIKFGSGVTSIGTHAFFECRSLTSITIPNSVTSIGYTVFCKCTSLTSITIGANVSSIGEGAFDECSSLTSIKVSTGNSNYCDINGVLLNKEKTILIAYPGGRQSEYTIPNSVTSIGHGAFQHCSLSSVIIGNGVTSIGAYAFYECSTLTSVTMGNSITNISNDAFDGCSGLTSITCEACIPPTCEDNAFDDVNKKIPLYVPASSINDYLAATPWKLFTNIRPIQAKEVDVTAIQTEPTENGVVIEWLAADEAQTYIIDIEKNGEPICTSSFNNQGQLLTSSYTRPAGNSKRGTSLSLMATQTSTGWQYTITGLDSGTLYDYTVTAKKTDDTPVYTQSGSFTTTGTATPIDQIDASTLQRGERGKPILRNGQVFILRGDKTYTLTGQEVK